MRLALSLSLMAGLAALAGGCAAPPAPVAACPAPPAPPAEVTPPLPRVVYHPVILQPGHWDWIDGHFAWVPSTWVERTPATGLFQPGEWAPGPTCQWLPAHWLPRSGG
jgi:hypothetical protein